MSKAYRSVPVRLLHSSSLPSASDDGESGELGKPIADSITSPAERTNPEEERTPLPRTDVPKTNETQQQSSDTSRRLNNSSASGRRPSPLRQQVLVNLENFEHLMTTRPPLKTIFNSPRSLQVCAEFGIHVTELLPRAPQDFLAPNVPESIAAMRYHHFESRRQEKLGLLRAARADRITESIKESILDAAAAASNRSHSQSGEGRNVADRHQHSAVAGTHEVAPQSTQRPVVRRPAAEGRPVLSRSSQQGTSAGLPRHSDPTIIQERSARREVVYERAMKARLEKDQQVIQRQLLKEQRAVAHRHACEAEKLKVIELRRLRWSDQRENIEHKKRQSEFLHLRQLGERPSTADMIASARVSSSRSSSAQRLSTSGVGSTKYMMLFAKEQYFTPQQREEKRRASSATR